MGIAAQALSQSIALPRMLALALVALLSGNAVFLASRPASVARSSGSGDVTRAALGVEARDAVPAPRGTGPSSAAPVGREEKARQSPPPGSSTSSDVLTDDGASELLPLTSEGYAYELTLSPTCGQPGDLFTATLKLKPKWGASGTIMPFYADGSREEGHGALPAPDGTVTYSWVARAVIGEGRLVTQAQDADTGEFGTKIVAFHVVTARSSC